MWKRMLPLLKIRQLFGYFWFKCAYYSLEASRTDNSFKPQKIITGICSRENNRNKCEGEIRWKRKQGQGWLQNKICLNATQKNHLRYVVICAVFQMNLFQTHPVWNPHLSSFLQDVDDKFHFEPMLEKYIPSTECNVHFCPYGAALPLWVSL